jgi:hypothetical protein
MSAVVEKPKNKSQNSSLLGRINVTPFEFEADQPLDDCAARLKRNEQTGHRYRLVGLTEIEITPDGEQMYQFYIRRKLGRSMSVIANGLMRRTSERSTMITGSARTGDLGLMFAGFGGIGILWLVVATQITPLLLILPFLFSLVVLMNLFFCTYERCRFVDFLKDSVRGQALAYPERKKRV